MFIKNMSNSDLLGMIEWMKRIFHPQKAQKK